MHTLKRQLVVCRGNSELSFDMLMSFCVACKRFRPASKDFGSDFRLQQTGSVTSLLFNTSI